MSREGEGTDEDSHITERGRWRGRCFDFGRVMEGGGAVQRNIVSFCQLIFPLSEFAGFRMIEV